MGISQEVYQPQYRCGSLDMPHMWSDPPNLSTCLLHNQWARGPCSGSASPLGKEYMMRSPPQSTSQRHNRFGSYHHSTCLQGT